MLLYTELYNKDNYLAMLGLKLIHVSKSGPITSPHGVALGINGLLWDNPRMTGGFLLQRVSNAESEWAGEQTVELSVIWEIHGMGLEQYVIDIYSFPPVAAETCHRFHVTRCVSPQMT